MIANPFDPPQILEVRPINEEDFQSVPGQWFLPQAGRLDEMLQAVLINQQLLEKELEGATANHLKWKQNRHSHEAISAILESELLEECPQVASELGNYRAECEAAYHAGAKGMLNGNSSFKL